MRNVARSRCMVVNCFLFDHSQNLVQWFVKCGYKMIVVVDSNITRDKLKEWLKRRAQRMEYLYSLNGKLKDTRGKHREHYQHSAHSLVASNWFAPNGSYFIIGKVFESIKHCKVIYAHVDADREIVGYAQLLASSGARDRVLGVIGNDSDFLIFNVHTYIQINSIKYCRRSHCVTCSVIYHSDVLKKV